MGRRRIQNAYLQVARAEHELIVNHTPGSISVNTLVSVFLLIRIDAEKRKINAFHHTLIFMFVQYLSVFLKTSGF